MDGGAARHVVPCLYQGKLTEGNKDMNYTNYHESHLRRLMIMHSCGLVKFVSRLRN